MKIGVRVKLVDYLELELRGGGIYRITSPSGKVYIGKSVNLKDRFSRYKRLDCHKQKKLYNSLIKHGIESHDLEILEESVDNDYLSHREMYYISLIKGDMLNITLGGGGSTKHGIAICWILYGRNLEGENLTSLSRTFNISRSTVESSIRRVGTPIILSKVDMGVLVKSRPHPMKGKKHAEETKLKISKAQEGREPWNKGVAHSENTKIKISKANFQLIPKEAINHLGEIAEVVSRKFRKKHQISEWHVLCEKLYHQNWYQKKKQRLKKNVR